VPLYDDQLLVIARPHRDHHPTAVRELLAEAIWDLRRRGRHEDAVIQLTARVAGAAITQPNLDVVAEAKLA
jgi:hypothetical protein